MSRRVTKSEAQPQRKCDNCGKECTDYRTVRVKAAGKANVYLAGTAKWCGLCRFNHMGTWKYH